MQTGKGLGACAHQQAVFAPLHHQTGQADRVLNALHGGDRAVVECGPVHDDGVHFDVTGGVEVGAAPGVERRIVFENFHRRFDGFERRAAVLQNRPAGLGREAATADVVGHFGVGDRSRAAMNDERGGWHRWRLY